MINEKNTITVNVKVEFITIPLEDYNQLLIYKGRYLELSNMFDGSKEQMEDPSILNPNLQFDRDSENTSYEEDSAICCEEDEEDNSKYEGTHEDLSAYIEE